MGLFQPLPQHQGRRRLPLGLALIAIVGSLTCLVAQTQFVFASQIHPVVVDSRMLLDRVRRPLFSSARLAGGAAVQCQTQSGTYCRAASTSSWSFRPGCIALMFAATAGIALTRKPRCTWRGAKAHRATSRCNVTGFDACPLLGSDPRSVCYTQGSVPAASPATHLSPVPATSPSEIFGKTLQPQPALHGSGLILSMEPPVTDSKPLAHRGLSSFSPAFRVSTARCARRRGGIGGGSRRASAAGRSRSARRAVGARLQATHKTPAAAKRAWDPSRLRIQLQAGFQILEKTNKFGQPRNFKQLSITCKSLVDHSRGIPCSTIKKSK